MDLDDLNEDQDDPDNINYMNQRSLIHNLE